MIKVKDVDMKQGVITLTHTKLGKHRQIPLSTGLHKRFIDYYQAVHLCSIAEDWFFPGYKNRPMTITYVEKNHRKFLWQAGISHPGRTKAGERGAPHHTFMPPYFRCPLPAELDTGREKHTSLHARFASLYGVLLLQ
jgi:hypothetical protein